MPDDVEIRWYMADDFDAVEKLIRDLANLFNDVFDSRFFQIYMDKRLLETVPGCYVAELDGEVVGSVFADVLRDPTGAQYGYISSLMIREDCRGKGIGEKLLFKAIQYLEIIRVPRIWANVREESKAMKHLFEKHNFNKKFSVLEYKPIFI